MQSIVNHSFPVHEQRLPCENIKGDIVQLIAWQVRPRFHVHCRVTFESCQDIYNACKLVM
jgi:hypothetical protein